MQNEDQHPSIQDEDDGIGIERIEPDHADFLKVLSLRETAYQTARAACRETVDERSIHVIAREDDRIIGALRVTCRVNGRLESEEAYPEWLLNEFGDQLCASSRMCIHPEFQATKNLPLRLKQFAWQQVLPLGVRLDVSKTRLKTIAFYMKWGYYFVSHPSFPFSGWERELGLRECFLIAFPANPLHQSPISATFTGIDSPCDLAASANSQMFVSKWRTARELIPWLESSEN